MTPNRPVIATASVEAKRSFSKEMNKLRRNQQILTILILLFVCMSFWIIVSLFSSQRSSKISPEINQMAKPLTPTLDSTVLDTLDAKVSYTDEELADFPIFILVRDNQTQEERIVPLGSAVLPVNTVQPTQTEQTGSALQNQLTTPTPQPVSTPEPTPEAAPVETTP